ncbi:MAG: SusD/RagB family nutrient-binding outer membrane lipoprotein, partial [Cyclobacteriaceae bacterium]|nr:SusD/RagB family nutrient-binding outer membrane lipoprotein [Cyclobacteriaceae bacterium]
DLIDVNLLLTRVQVRSIKEETPNGTGTIGNYSGMSYSSANRPFQEGDSPGVWNNSYTRYTNNLSEIIRLTKDDPELVNKKAIARIMKVWAFAKVTDTYGDIPYFQSSLPQEDAIYNPTYDTQKSIYEDFFMELKAAASEMDASKESYGAADLVYGGDVDKWRKFANSLRLRLALRLRYVDKQMAIDNMSDLQEADLILSREDDANMFTSTDNQDNNNSNYVRVLNSGSSLTKRGIGQEIVNNMINKNDPRIKIWADTAKAEFPKDDPDLDYFGYRGTPLLGLVPVENKYPWGLESASRISDLWYVQVIEIPVLRSSEMYFALAESVLFGLRSGDAQGYYKKGMEEALNWAKEFYDISKPQLPDVLERLYPDWSEADIELLLTHKELTQGEIDTFLATPAAVLSGSPEEQLEQIIVQKNIGLYPQEYQNWAEWRRTGYPIVQVGPDDDDLKGESPRRMPWPNVEQTVNGDNYAEAETRISGGDLRLSKVWWDANPNVPYYNPDPVPWMATPWVQ